MVGPSRFATDNDILSLGKAMKQRGWGVGDLDDYGSLFGNAFRMTSGIVAVPAFQQMLTPSQLDASLQGPRPVGASVVALTDEDRLEVQDAAHNSRGFDQATYRRVLKDAGLMYVLGTPRDFKSPGALGGFFTHSTLSEIKRHYEGLAFKVEVLGRDNDAVTNVRRADKVLTITPSDVALMGEKAYLNKPVRVYGAFILRGNGYLELAGGDFRSASRPDADPLTDMKSTLDTLGYKWFRKLPETHEEGEPIDIKKGVGRQNFTDLRYEMRKSYDIDVRSEDRFSVSYRGTERSQITLVPGGLLRIHVKDVPGLRRSSVIHQHKDIMRNAAVLPEVYLHQFV